MDRRLHLSLSQKKSWLQNHQRTTEAIEAKVYNALHHNQNSFQRIPSQSNILRKGVWAMYLWATQLCKDYTKPFISIQTEKMEQILITLVSSKKQILL